MKKYTLLLLLFVYVNSLAQEKEYFVNKFNDTIYGKITRSSSFINPSKVRFKIKDENGKKRLIYPNDVKTIRSIKGVDGNCVIKTVYDKWFIKKIIDGRITIYQLIGGSLYFISKDNDQIKSADFGGFESRTKAHSKIRLLIADNPKILEEFDTLKGSEKNIFYIIKKYNALQN